ncbi:MAG: hypothetical protein LLF76_08885 [Planctomycetaceae bacterium]|nr:hypothetical protein [Planctomycetaceae bacterium]
MKRLIVTFTVLLLSGLTARAAQWYDPEGWLDQKERTHAEWWYGRPETARRSFNIYGYDSGTWVDRGWGYGYDYYTTDWDEYNDSFTKWYNKSNRGG